MKNTLSFLAVATGCVLTGWSVQSLAAEKYAPYEGFKDKALSAARWGELERIRRIDNGKLVMLSRDVGEQFIDAGVVQTNFSSGMAAPNSISRIQATVQVNTLEMTGCANNTDPSVAAARLVGSFFNLGNPTSGSQVGDVVAKVSLRRLSSASTDPGVLQVEGQVVACSDSDCTNSTSLGLIDMGTAMVGDKVTLEVGWDADKDRFLFSRDKLTPKVVTYALTDTKKPSVAFKQLGTQSELANCLSGPRTEVLIQATFDNVSIGSSLP